MSAFGQKQTFDYEGHASECGKSVEGTGGSTGNFRDLPGDHELPSLPLRGLSGDVFQIAVIDERQPDEYLCHLVNRPTQALHAGRLHVVDGIPDEQRDTAILQPRQHRRMQASAPTSVIPGSFLLALGPKDNGQSLTVPG